MAGKRFNLLRVYHLLIVREPEGFSWQVRYGRHANPVEKSTRWFATHAEAVAEGEHVVDKHRRAAGSEV